MEAELQVVNGVQQHVKDLFEKNSDPRLVYHNLKHTEFVVEKCAEIGTAENLSDEEKELVAISAWFHDVGYFEGMKGHEERSAEIAESRI